MERAVVDGFDGYTMAPPACTPRLSFFGHWPEDHVTKDRDSLSVYIALEADAARYADDGRDQEGNMKNKAQEAHSSECREQR